MIFELLADERRREALYALYRREDPVPVADLAEEVASAVAVGPEHVANSLHHVHLPKLADAGIVEYDVEAKTVRLADAFDRFHRYLHMAAKDEGRFLGPADEEVTSGTPDAP